MPNKSQYIRRGAYCLTRKQYNTLCLLREAKGTDQPFVILEIKTPYDERSVQIMQEKDWVVQSTKVFPGKRCFTITGRALKVLQALEVPPPRKNKSGDLCATCGKQPRYISPAGRKTPYCRACQNSHNRRYYAERGYTYSADLPCSRCKSAPRVIKDGEVISAYCTSCRRVTNRTRKQRFLVRSLENKARGNLSMCPRCGLQPIHITPSHAYGICRICYNADKRRYMRKAIVRRVQARMKSKS
jgi:hypothetical protein